MSVLSEIGIGFTLWIDAVAATVKRALERFEATRRIGCGSSMARSAV